MLVLLYGYGGHEAEMRSLLENLNLKGLKYSLVREEKSNVIYIKDCFLENDFTIPRFREYNYKDRLQSLRSLIISFRYFVLLMFKHKNLTFVSLGPGFTVLFSILSRICSFKFVHIESCCRFYIKSYTGRMCENFADYIFVQNQEALRLFPKAKYIGNLMVGPSVNTCNNSEKSTIFITVGTTSFDDLIKAVNLLPQEIRSKIICQFGPSSIVPSCQESFRYTSNINSYYINSEVVVCHAGAGTVFKLLTMNKKIIVIPNISRIDKHQVDLSNYIRKNNYACVINDVEELPNSIDKIKNMKFNKFDGIGFINTNFFRDLFYHAN